MNVPIDVLADAFVGSKFYKKAFSGPAQLANWEALVPSVLDQYCIKKGISLGPEEKCKVIKLAAANRNGDPDSGTAETVPHKARLF